jgi:pimeloyl-ACP methyl ester carboxylesterase
VKKARRVVLAFLAGAASLYLLVSLVGRLAYRSLLYPAPPFGDDAAPPAGARVVALQAADGVSVHALEFANPAAARTVVYFHGNGEVAGDMAPLAQRLVAMGLAVTLAEYRGYGRSRGIAPTEEGLYADAMAVLDDLAARGFGTDRVVVWGASLGTGVAVEMARRRRAAALVLVAPYTSLPDMAAGVAPLLPVRLLVGDRFDNLAKAPSLRIPTIVVHGTDDEVIPFAMGARVARAIPGCRFEPVTGGHHMDCLEVDAGLLERIVRAVSP